MNKYNPNVMSWVERTGDARRDRSDVRYVFRSDGVLVSRQRQSRLGFPFRGLILGFAITVAVKAYLIWFLGQDLYQAEMLRLLSGTVFEQAAARILMPDQLSMWGVGGYDWVAALMSGAATDL
ncbi:hypothetical protein HKCCSP123_08740 [Rhodobacterales bacterium HKCCSP123]|nr:hypothetical protein [Rhodobacterales bacterium HKCCSP123]